MSARGGEMTHRDAPDDTGDMQQRSLGELLKQLSEETTRLVRQELELAKAEVSEKSRKAGAGAGLFGVAGAIGLLAAGALTACIVLALAHLLPAWSAALLVAVVYGVVAGLLALRGREKVKLATPPLPDQTIETVKEDVQWAKTQMRSDTK
jgi:hypothetical protein